MRQEWEWPESLALSIGESHSTLDLGGACPASVMLVSCLTESDEYSGIDDSVEMACD